MLPAAMELPFASYPTNMCGDTLDRSDQTKNGLNPAAPAPRKLSASPVGTRTSTPKANAALSPFQATPFTLNVISPMPEAVPALEDELVRQREETSRSREWGMAVCGMVLNVS